MYRILLVDDVALIRKGMIKVIRWEELGAELAGEADDGESAMKAIEKLEPDIVVTDIRMPEYGGIELLKYIHLNRPQIQTIVISGYNNFEYAQQAIKSGSLDYILKPVDPDELNAAIKNACSLLEQKKEKSINEFENRGMEDYFYRIIHGADSGNGWMPESIARLCIPGSMFCLAVIRRETRTGGIQDFSRTDIPKGRNGEPEVICIVEGSEESVWVFYAGPGNCAASFERWMVQKLQSLVQQRETQNCVVAGIGRVVGELGALPVSYHAAYEAIVYTLLDEKGLVISHYQVVGRKLYNIPLEEYEKRLSVCISLGLVDEIKAVIDIVFQKLLEHPDISMDSIRLVLTKLCHLLLRQDSTLAAELLLFTDRINHPEYLLTFRSIENIRTALVNLFTYTAGKFSEEQGGKSLLIANVKAFIKENYQSDVGLEQIAGMFHISGPYLSVLFKKETGENLNDFITGVRIGNAKMLLSQRSLKIARVAEMVGYQDQNYFYKVFKKVTGMTPKQFQSTKVF